MLAYTNLKETEGSLENEVGSDRDWRRGRNAKNLSDDKIIVTHSDLHSCTPNKSNEP